MPRGGYRPGGGRPKGSREKLTIQREAVRQRIFDRLVQQESVIVDALLAEALGHKFLVYRDEYGKFLAVTERQAKNIKAKNFERLEVWDRRPSGDALKEVLLRLLGTEKQTLEHEAGSTLEDVLARAVILSTSENDE